jgi:hypothetical protein
MTRDAFQDRERALENEYFRRKEQEALARLRAQMQTGTSGEAMESKPHGEMRCPRDGSELVAVRFNDVQVDRCVECGGLWLDAGEIEHLTHHDESGGFFDSMRRTLIGS